MSVTLLLIPVALAAATVAGTSGVAGVVSMLVDENASTERGETADVDAPRPIAVQTRMKDEGLLMAALHQMGARGLVAAGGEIAAEIDGLALRLVRTPDQIWQLHVERVDGHEIASPDAVAVAERLDASYAGQVQRAVAERIRTRADAAGFELTSETRDEDDTLTMVLTVKDYA